MMKRVTTYEVSLVERALRNFGAQSDADRMIEMLGKAIVKQDDQIRELEMEIKRLKNRS